MSKEDFTPYVKIYSQGEIEVGRYLYRDVPMIEIDDNEDLDSVCMTEETFLAMAKQCLIKLGEVDCNDLS